ncbi:MAG: acetyltransferase [Reichenbachiella sp.]
MAKILIFGLNDFAELAHYYLSTDSDHEVVAFIVDPEYLPTEKTFKDLPIVSSDNLFKYPPHSFKAFAPMAPTKMNQVRQKIYNGLKSKGYEMISYISSKATTFNGEIGDNCFILENNTIQPFTKIGNNVVLWSGNHIGHHSIIKDHVSFTSHVVLSGHCIVEECCFLGVNATIRDGITLAKGSLIAMDASVTRSTEEWGIYLGIPAMKKGNKPSHEIL